MNEAKKNFIKGYNNNQPQLLKQILVAVFQKKKLKKVSLENYLAYKNI